MILLAFLSATAIYGSYGLLMDVSGEYLGLPLEVLEHTPFTNFLIPAIILLVAIGLLSLMIFFLVLRKRKNYSIWVIFQGVVLLIWLTVEWIYGIFDGFFTVIYLLVAVSLILLGGLSIKAQNN